MMKNTQIISVQKKCNYHLHDKIKILLSANLKIFECEFSRLLNPS